MFFENQLKAAEKQEPRKTFIVKEITECSICFMDFENGEEIKQLDCHKMHIFHPECIAQWIKAAGKKKDSFCPLCRKKIEEKKMNDRKYRKEEEEEVKKEENKGFIERVAQAYNKEMVRRQTLKQLDPNNHHALIIQRLQEDLARSQVVQENNPIRNGPGQGSQQQN